MALPMSRLLFQSDEFACFRPQSRRSILRGFSFSVSSRVVAPFCLWQKRAAIFCVKIATPVQNGYWIIYGYSPCSLITDVIYSFTLMIVSRLHLGQNSGEFSSTVSGRSFILVLPLQTGHKRNSILRWFRIAYLTVSASMSGSSKHSPPNRIIVLISKPSVLISGIWDTFGFITVSGR